MIRSLEMLVWYSIDYDKMQELEGSLMERQDPPIKENAPEEDPERKKESDT
jgi:hypothetical protein